MVKNYKKLPKKKQEEICRKERERYHRNKEADEAADAKKKKLSRESSRRHREKKRRENELSVTNPTMTPVTPSKSKSKSRQLTRVGTPNTTGRKLVGRVKTPHNTDRQLASRADTPNTTGRQVVASGTTIDHLLLATNDPKEAMGLMNMWGRIAAQNTLQSAAESNKDITEASRANMEKFLAGDDAPDDGKDEDYTNDDLDDIKNGNLFANVAGSRKKTVSFASTDGDSDEDSYVFKEDITAYEEESEYEADKESEDEDVEVVEVPAKKITVSKTIMNSASKKANASIPVKKSLSTPKPTIKKSLSTPKPTVVSTKKCTPAKKITAVKKPSTVKQTIASKKPAFSKQTIASAKKSAIAKKTTSSAKKVTLAKTNTKVKANTKEIEGTPPGTAKKYTKAEKMAIKQRVKADSVVQKQMMEERIAEAAKAESDDSGFYYSEQRTPTPTKAPSRTSTRRSTRCRK